MSPLPTTNNPQPPATPNPQEPWRTPWVQLKHFSFNPSVYPSMIRTASKDSQAGDLVSVYDRDGQPFGVGFYNPKARVPLRMVYHGREPKGEDYLESLLDQAVDLRLDSLHLPDVTDAFRVVHSQGDSLSGLVVDRYADVLSVDVHSLAVFQRLGQWLPCLHKRLGTQRAVIEADPKIAAMEGIRMQPAQSDPTRAVRIREHGVRYEVNFEQGHKTGFFCDQRDNRRRFAAWTQGRKVLDLCCYTGGFALAAKVLGGATDATGVDLDEKAVAQARANANLNQTRVEWVHGDAFAYARQMQKNGRLWDTVVLDPPKLILSRDEQQEGLRKYEDLNHLAVTLVERGGLFVTCSCSGLLASDEFELIVCRGAHRAGRRLQILDRTGAGQDHPVMSNAPEGRYLKVLWARVL